MAKLSTYAQIASAEADDMLHILKKTAPSTYVNRDIPVSALLAASVPSPTVIYVNVEAGSDSTGTGQPAAPFATIQKAIDVIDARADNTALDIGVTAKPYVIQVAPGYYPENIDLNKPNLVWLTLRAENLGSVCVVAPAYIRCNASNDALKLLYIENFWMSAPLYSFKSGVSHIGWQDCAFNNCLITQNSGAMEIESTPMGFTETIIQITVSAINASIYLNNGSYQDYGLAFTMTTDDAKPDCAWGNYALCDNSQIGSLTLSGTAAKPNDFELRHGGQIRGTSSIGAYGTLYVRGPNFHRGNLTFLNNSAGLFNGDFTVDGNLVVNTGAAITMSGCQLGVSGTRTIAAGTITGNQAGWYDNSASGLTADTVQGAIDELATGLIPPTVIYADVKAGNDTTGNGSMALPFKTIQKAIDVIDARADNVGLSDPVDPNAKPYVIQIAPGYYSESLDFNKANLRWLTVRGDDYGTTYIKLDTPTRGYVRCDANNTNFEYLSFVNLWINAHFSFKGGTWRVDLSFSDCYLMGDADAGDILVESSVLSLYNTYLIAGITATNSYIGMSGGTGQQPNLPVILQSDDAKPDGPWGTYSLIDAAQIGSVTVSGTAALPGELHLRQGCQVRGDLSIGANGALYVRGPNFIRGNLEFLSGSGGTLTGDLTIQYDLTVNAGAAITMAGCQLGVGGTRTIAAGTITGNQAGWYDNSASGLTADTVQGALDELVKSGDIPNNQAADYALQLTDAGKTIWMNSGSANSVTIPLASSVAFPVGTQLCVAMEGVGVTSVKPAIGVTLNGVLGDGTKKGAIAAQYLAATLVKRGTDTWIAIGSIGAVA